MLEDRIIVQDRGIDAGLAALMQNANRGNMDPAALMAMMNNNGMGGNGGWWWIWIILLFFCWGGNGFGFGGRNAGALASQLASCCCDLRQEVCGINNNITRMGYENQLANCNQTNTLQNAITSGFNSLMADNASKFNIIGSKIDAQTQIINDKFCQLEMREMQNKIEALRDEKQAYQLSASQQAQTANIVNQIRPCPVPAYLTCNPFGCNGGFSGYGYGYGEGCNC